jgi:dolichol-phosphate mannosyltransferase
VPLYGQHFTAKEYVTIRAVMHGVNDDELRLFVAAGRARPSSLYLVPKVHRASSAKSYRTVPLLIGLTSDLRFILAPTSVDMDKRIIVNTLADLERASASIDYRLAHSAPIVSVIIPTFNERENVARIAEAVRNALADIPFEIVFVDDDSIDGTLEVLVGLSRSNPRIRFIHRIGRRGLSTAVIEGVLSTSTPFVAVIDADLQHDERILPDMLAYLQTDAADLVIGSRYAAGGALGKLDKKRVWISAVATWLAKLITRADISDPMSGFFVISRPAFESAVRGISGHGYKILLDICASAEKPLRVREVPYEFRTRQAGESKLDALVTWEYMMLLADKLFGHIVPVKFVSFTLIGGLGVGVHMCVLYALVAITGATFIVGQIVATVVAMIFNFFVNNTLTYRDRRLKGVRALAGGLVTFVAACSVGGLTNVGIANYLFSDRQYVWWLAGLAGIVVGAVWNYAATSVVTWGRR